MRKHWAVDGAQDTQALKSTCWLKRYWLTVGLLSILFTTDLMTIKVMPFTIKSLTPFFDYWLLFRLQPPFPLWPPLHRNLVYVAPYWPLKGNLKYLLKVSLLQHNPETLHRPSLHPFLAQASLDLCVPCENPTSSPPESPTGIIKFLSNSPLVWSVISLDI